jgi:hypothetical protein
MDLLKVRFGSYGATPRTAADELGRAC